MILDSSAIVAILENEPEREAFTALVSSASRLSISAVTYMETSLVLAKRRGASTASLLDVMVASLGIAIVPLSQRHAQIARNAYLRFGKGFHPAALNLGDCASYALAIDSGDPLLYKGGDFAQTDIASAIT